jgi:prepilin-type N-terminal cleavage/methylation domain-containing protein
LSGLLKRKGLTLIELLVTLAIVVITALIAIPGFNTLIKYYRITGAAQQLYSALQYARTEAVKRNANVYMSVTTGDSWCYGFNTGSTCSCSTAGSCNLGSYSASAPLQLTLSATGLTSNAIYFTSTHGGSSSSATFTYTNYGLTSLITTSISMLGSISVCSTGVNGYTAC